MKRNVSMLITILLVLAIGIMSIFYFQNKKASSSKIEPDTEELEENDSEEEQEENTEETDTTGENQTITNAQESVNTKKDTSSTNTQGERKTENTTTYSKTEETVTPTTASTEQETSKSENIIVITETKKPISTESTSPTVSDTSNNIVITVSTDKVTSDDNHSTNDTTTNNGNNNSNNDNNNNSNNSDTTIHKPDSTPSDKVDTDTTSDKDKDDKDNEEEKPISNKTAQEVINEMGAGWNLGNTLDSANFQKEFLHTDKNISYYETLWGNPTTTKNMIDAIKKAGFKSIRVPVTYYDHMSNDGTIDEKWLDRVEEVINYVLKNNMYCILDIHHDTGLFTGGTYIVADADKFEENAEKLKKMWIQIGNRFKDYDDHLIFEGFNEMVDQNKTYDWNSGYQHTLTVYKLNQVFVDTVRSTGGNNKTRFLAVSTFGSITDEQKLSTFTLPKDTAKDKIILALHDYADTTSGIDSMFERIKKYCTSKNIPVILDEYGMFKTNFKTEEERAKMTSYYVSEAKKLNIACYWWDNGNKDEYAIFNRKNLTWEYPKIKDAIIKAS